ncbi:MULTISPECIES: hypothetical protein [Muribaculaceae]|jgi:hypothetical protein|uniref:Uncharacterized protein n=1 Tax=Lepagella muris TaxID=3032870 RepID=A0AC61RJP5_9BACT|nr:MULTISPECIES: hypothetical protein [Muribaculaceae]NBH91138.1 hypothetical protein [Muribaculaceae bacterium S4]NBI19464.1 hypothetical protein [Muribaculaceae bacterium Z1]THG53224.1 hypothetical protein E5984_03915 [Bacteroidales bacterium]TGY79986.1 hypothetical protein E5331_04145 [Lepagella muris]TKC64891.1 hypothetical protein E5359_001890 [Bacteroidales bacterium]
MKNDKTNGLIIEGDVYVPQKTDNPDNRCEKCECDWCDGEKLGDRLCEAVAYGDEYLILSHELTNRIKGQ